jgi:D-sedoheptulose 7-phosphate isomerase
MMNTASAYLDELTRLLSAMEIKNRAGDKLSLDEGGKAALNLIRETKEKKAKAVVVGNGGSAAIASHMQNDLCKAVKMRALVFTEQSLLTALANDDGYQTAYETLMNLWADAEDLLIAISSSGQSENILRCAQAARKAGGRIVTLSGFAADNPLRSLGDVNFYIPSHSYGHVELAHAALSQFLTDALKDE